MGSSEKKGVKPLVDVVIPVYNGEKFIRQAIESVIRQTCPVNKIIVVDDGSTDSSGRIVLSLKDKTQIEIEYIKKENGGLSSARNCGLRYVKSEFVAFLDADDEWFETKIQKQMEVYEKSEFENLGVVYGGYEYIDENGGELHDCPILEPQSDARGRIFRKLLEGNVILGSASNVLVKRECFDDAGVFDESLEAAEDWDMWLRIAKKFAFDYTKAELVRIRIHGDNMQKNQMHMFVNELKFKEKWARILAAEKIRCPLRWSRAICVRLLSSFPDTVLLDVRKPLFDANTSRKLFWMTLGRLDMAFLLEIIIVFVSSSWSYIVRHPTWLRSAVRVMGVNSDRLMRDIRIVRRHVLS